VHTQRLPGAYAAASASSLSVVHEIKKHVL